MQRINTTMLLCIVILSLVTLGACLAFVYQVISPLIAEFREGVSILFVVFVLCLVVLCIALTYNLVRFMSSRVNRMIAHESLLTWLPDHGAMYMHDGKPLHLSAMHNSAQVSTFALEQASRMEDAQNLLSEGKPFEYESLDSQVDSVRNLLSQGKSERKIAAQLKTTRSKIQQIKGMI